jgi:hypothetical protein
LFCPIFCTPFAVVYPVIDALFHQKGIRKGRVHAAGFLFWQVFYYSAVCGCCGFDFEPNAGEVWRYSGEFNSVDREENTI